MREIYGSCSFTLVADLITYIEAIRVKEWQNAMKEELLVIQGNETCELIDLPKGKNSISLKWILKAKYDVDKRVQRHKA